MMTSKKIVLAMFALVATMQIAVATVAAQPSAPSTPPTPVPPTPVTNGSASTAVAPMPVTPVPVTPAPVEPAPVVPAPVEPAPVPPPPVTPAPAPVKPAEPDKPFHSELYSRARGLGIFHKGHAYVGVLGGDTFDATGMATSSTGAVLAFEGVFLGMPSLYGNMHGIEGFASIRTGPTDVNVGFGFPVTFFNIGRGQPLSLRLGGSFGVGIGNQQAFGYIRGRGAVVVIPDRLDLEASAQWTPSSASNAFGDAVGDFDTRTLRATAWYRYGKGKAGRFIELYVEYFERTRIVSATVANPTPMVDRTDDVAGLGLGLGITLF